MGSRKAESCWAHIRDEWQQFTGKTNIADGITMFTSILQNLHRYP